MASSRKKPIIELHNGFFWDCDECGRENFVRGMGVPLMPGDKEFIREQYKINKKDEGKHFFFIAPLDVKCDHCGETYDCTLRGIS